MASPGSPVSKHALKRRRSWRTLPVVVFAITLLFGLWHISFIHHFPVNLHAKLSPVLQGGAVSGVSNAFDMKSESEVQARRLLEIINKVVLGSGRLPEESLLPELKRLLVDLNQTMRDPHDVSRARGIETLSSPENISIISEKLQTMLSENFRLTEEKMMHELQVIKSENERLKGQFVNHLIENPAWRTLKDLSKVGLLGFLSDVADRGAVQGPPQFHEFPSALSSGRHLCFLGNDTSNGTRNSYTYAWRDALPKGHIFLPGTTLISETTYDYENPWHSMYNLVQFVWWKQANQCARAERMLLYHWSELRRQLGGWISEVFAAAGLPTVPFRMEIGDRPVCFQKAVVSRTGIGGVPQEILQDLYKEVRCVVRRYCKIPLKSFERSKTLRVRITLVVRSKTRAWKNQTEWEEVIARECDKVKGCEWRSMAVSNLSFCEQVSIMGQTDILVSVHGAQLTNMIFMSPGGKVLEMFPKGWLELAGHGQFIYKFLALWVGLHHEGYWRDLNHADCPYGNDAGRCMTHYKDLPVGINVTYASNWLRDVITRFSSNQLMSIKLADGQSKLGPGQVQWDTDVCACNSQHR